MALYCTLFEIWHGTHTPDARQTPDKRLEAMQDGPVAGPVIYCFYANKMNMADGGLDRPPIVRIELYLCLFG